MKMVTLGLKENWKQFTLLVIINAFVGGMVGLERSILPQIAEYEFHMAAKTAILSFIIVFGIVKAITNYFTGSLANRVGRKKLLTIGWLFAIPIPFILMAAPNWNWIVFANVLLGISQGLTWSSTVVMKIDLVGEKQRGFAMGLNEFAGYLSVAIVAFFTGWIASKYGLRPYPFYIGIGLSLLGFFGSWFLIKDTKHHVTIATSSNNIPLLKNIFWETTWKNKNLGSVTLAGLINNLNDGMVWGIFPILLTYKNFSLDKIAIIVAIYPAVWGLGQLVTGKMADHFSKNNMLFIGMFLQSIALLIMPWAQSMFHYITLSVILGWGTAMVYPTFLATIAENTNPSDRAKSLGVFRLWRDLGYAIGAILTGVIADALGINASIIVIGLLTVASALIIKYRMESPKKVTEVNYNDALTPKCLPIQELNQLLIHKKEQVTIIDVRSREEYEAQHIPKAINIELSQLVLVKDLFNNSDTVVTVCGKGGGRSIQAAEQLLLLGYNNSSWLCGGTFGWMEFNKD